MTGASDQLPERFNMAAYAIGRAAAARPQHPALLVMADPDGAPAEILDVCLARGRGAAHRRRAAGRWA